MREETVVRLLGVARKGSCTAIWRKRLLMLASGTHPPVALHTTALMTSGVTGEVTEGAVASGSSASPSANLVTQDRMYTACVTQACCTGVLAVECGLDEMCTITDKKPCKTQKQHRHVIEKGCGKPDAIS